MYSFCKTGIVFNILIAVIGNVESYCNETLNARKCAYDVYCDDFRDYDKGFEFFRYIDDEHINNDNNPMNENVNEFENDRTKIENTRSCNIITYTTNNYYGNQFYPVHFIYRATRSLALDIPERSLNVLITQLDLSNNNYEFMPFMHNNYLSNLALLNLSINSLTVAELSGEVLPLLTEIDLSHNTIRDIRYLSGHEYRKLKKIDLSYNYLIKIPDAAFDPFNELKTLDVSHNYIEILSQSTFEGIKQLNHLNVSYNRISDINASLFRFVELKVLDLSNNNIKAIKASDFNNLKSLETLDLNFNFISVIDKDSFYYMPYLRSLYLNNNKLVDVEKDVFKAVTKIEVIDLSENDLTELPKSLFKGKMIKRFSITENRLKGTLKQGMFEGLAVDKLDLSNQEINSATDYAFNGLVTVRELLLNNNNISVLTVNSFKTLQSLRTLDLSFNKIQSIEFAKDDLYNLLSLSLRNNYLTVVKQENFHGLNSLQFLDLSDNKIRQVETNSFVSLKELINFEISNNPLSGTLEKSTFDGLSSLPSLDISCTLLSSVQNGSFLGMVQLKKLNISHSKINTLEYNIFVHTGAIEAIDLSFNELKDFNINSTELFKLDTLYINNNFIKTLDSSTFKSISRLTKLNLAHNLIQNINPNVFRNHKYLRKLDVSFNSNLNLTLSLLTATKTVNVIDLSGIKTGISFGNIKDMSVTHLTITKSSISDVKNTQLNELRHLDDLNLSFNEIPKLEVGIFDNISSLRFLDLSHNIIKDIQPRIFKDNTLLVSLNVSHNFLTAISYGIFHGLIYLSALDISYNQVNNLQNERFYEVRSLSVLIADHNKIESISEEEFVGTSLTKLSIGGNPIPCKVLVNLKQHGVPFEITASKLYENNDENVNGVTCNRKIHTFDRSTNSSRSNADDNVKILFNIRDIMLDFLNNEHTSKSATNFDEKYLSNITDQIQTSSKDINYMTSALINSTAHIITENKNRNDLLNKIHAKIANNDTNILLNQINNTNVLLNKILRVLTLNSATRTPPVQVTKDNATYENLLSYINKVKQDLEDAFQINKDSILNEMEAKISAANLKTNQNKILLATESPKSEKLSISEDSKFLFTETCVALILVILVGFVLFKVYKSGIFVRQRFSVSTRELPGSMDSPL